MTLLIRVLPYLAAIAAVVALMVGAYSHGVDTTHAHWESKWKAQELAATKAKAKAEAEARATEQTWQNKINEVQSSAQDEINQARADALAADVAATGLREQADRLGKAASAGACSASTTKRGQAATTAGMVLADVLKRADERAGQLAAAYDHARAAGLACQQAYATVRGQ
jgi:hypothetical protein